ncbi:EamA-like transporter family protein [Lacibacter cauensis]|uniref:EamA-like transporter family protein n=1 Tax=Lacibacter cauensis TaxID=510947 RepID=A0A562SS37_9BACT|nr:DMT family transporter [Lacibacter cauensis]TWI83610.1 EamA-like transporter family protein [Lacibacter cauensis]
MQPKLFNWLLFLLLCFIWGSSFILMKEGLRQLSAYEVAAIRMLSAGLVLLPFAVRSFQRMQKKDLGLLVLTGILGSFIPAILFCVAETQIDSALAGMLNALTPFFVILIGAVFFQSKVAVQKIVGVFIGFSGMLLLFLSQKSGATSSNIFFAVLIVIATLSYGLNVNMTNRYLKHVGSLDIAAIAFVSLIPASLAVLLYNGFTQHQLADSAVIRSVAAASVLGIFGTAIASILFYMLLKRAGTLFSTMVTYGIPFVAVGWGLLVGETVGLMQMAGLVVILSGVYITNRQ